MSIKKLKVWLKSNLPEIVNDLNDSATIEQINSLENKLSVQFSSVFKELYLQHNGQQQKINTGMFYGLDFLSLDNIEKHWIDWVKIIDETTEEDMKGASIFCESCPPKAIKIIYANKKWIPFAYDWGGNYLGLDFDPDENGTIGQVINFGREEDKKFVVAKGFDEFLDWYVEQLEKGNFNIVVEDDGGKSFNTKEPPKFHFLDSIKEMFQV